MSALMIWHYSPRVLSHQTIEAHRLSYDEFGSFACHDEEIVNLLNVISRPLDIQTKQRLQRLACSASVHPEAALMGFLFHDPCNVIFEVGILDSKLSPLISSYDQGTELPIVISSACCRLLKR